MTNSFIALFFALSPLLGTPEADSEPAKATSTQPSEFDLRMAAKGPHFSLTSGRGTLVAEGLVEGLATTTTRRTLPSSGHFELAAVSDLELRWAGKGSMQIEGPAAFDWHGDPFGTKPSGAFRLIQVSDIDLEVRRGPLVLGLPGHVEMTVTHGVLRINESASGKYSLSLLGGVPLELEVPTADGTAHVVIKPGKSLWIDPSALNEIAAIRDEKIQAVLAAELRAELAAQPIELVSAPAQVAALPIRMPVIQRDPLAELVADPTPVDPAPQEELSAVALPPRPVLDPFINMELYESVEPVIVEPIIVEPIIVEPIIVEPIIVEPVIVEPIAVEPIAVEPIAVEPIAVEPIAVEPIAVEPVVNVPELVLLPAPVRVHSTEAQLVGVKWIPMPWTPISTPEPALSATEAVSKLPMKLTLSELINGIVEPIDLEE